MAVRLPGQNPVQMSCGKRPVFTMDQLVAGVSQSRSLARLGDQTIEGYARGGTSWYGQDGDEVLDAGEDGVPELDHTCQDKGVSPPRLSPRPGPAERTGIRLT